MGGKSEATWNAIKAWCMKNPGKNAAIYTPYGTFTVMFTPSKEEE